MYKYLFILLLLPALRTTAQSKTTSDTIIQLQTVDIKSTGYKQDSANFHKEYAKSLNFKPTRFREIFSEKGVNINKVYYALSVKKNKKKLKFKKQLIDHEHDEFVQYKYSRGIVNRLTKLEGDSLTMFMEQYHPTYEFMKDATDYDLYEFITKSYNDYRNKNK